MSTPLPVIQTDTSTYERPTQPWVCGRAAEGTPCQLGPDKRGRCRTTAECRPARKGDGWACSRPAAAGGPCTEGSAANGACSHLVPPCRPVRSLRSLRGLATCCVSVLSVGVLCWLVGGGSTRQNIASPGDLSFKHGTVTQTCATCHTTDVDNPASWVTRAAGEHGGIHESHLCLNCHQLGQDALAPHGLSGAALADIHHQLPGQEPSSANTPWLLGAARHWPGQPQTGGELACALCHREHQGKDAKLAVMDDQRCQACHTTQFPSFGNGHPEFAGYPYHRRTRLAYNHVSHLGRHYKEFQRIMPDGKAPTSCLDCHEQGPGGRMMLVKDFEHTCARCHLKQIEDPTLGGIAVLNLPGLDIRTLSRHQEAATVGEWPEAASGDLSPFMRLLLSTDERFVRADKVLHNVDLRDLRGANAAQLKAVEDYVWAIKNLFNELTHDEAMELRRRLEKILNRHLDVHELSSLTGDLPRELVRETQERWLPGLTSEVEARRAHPASPVPGASAWGLSVTPSAQGPFLAVPALLAGTNAWRNRPAPKPPPTKLRLPEGQSRWYADDVQFTLSFRPKGHAGDFMRTWLDRSAEAPASDSPAPLRAVFVSLSDPFGPGRCTKCHSVDRAGEGFKVNWLTSREMLDERPFTKFAHVPHFSLLGDRGCRTCHVLNEQGDVSRGFVAADHSLNTDPKLFESSFKSMGKATCATCHIQKAAGDSCLTCHNYHIGHLPPAMPSGRFTQGGGP